NLFQERAQQLLAIAVRCGRGVPDLMKIGTQSLNAPQLLSADHAGLLLLLPPQLRFSARQIAQATLPFSFQAARDQTVLGLDCPITAFTFFDVISQALNLKSPLCQRGAVIVPGLLYGHHHCFHGGRCDHFEKSASDSMINGNPSNAETVQAATLDDVFSGAVITRSRVAAAIMRAQAASAMTADTNALQQCGPFSHDASHLMRSRASVRVETFLICLEGCPVDEPRVVFGNENAPLVHGKMTHAFFDCTLFIDITFAPALAISVSASIHRIGQYVMNRGVSRDDPTNLTMRAVLQREQGSFRAQPEPDAAR